MKEESLRSLGAIEPQELLAVLRPAHCTVEDAQAFAHDGDADRGRAHRGPTVQRSAQRR